MKSFSDVCKIIGISRKTLRGYNEIGLVHPVRSGAIPPENEKDLRPQYYTDEDVNKLMLAQIFAEAGYTRKEIKENANSDWYLAAANAIVVLAKYANRAIGNWACGCIPR